MFDKKNIDIMYRLICLTLFIVVVLFVNSPITLGLLVLFFFLMTKNNNDFTFIILYVISFLSFSISYMSGNYWLMKIGVIINYIFYFLNVPSLNKLLTNSVDKVIDKYSHKEKIVEEVMNDDNQDSEDDFHYMRFSNNMKNKRNKKSDGITVFYVTVHFVVLFLSILVG